MNPAIELVEVEKRFGDSVAVHPTSLAIGTGEFFSLLGPSGCGKTTTLRMIAGFEQPTAGSIRMMGEDITSVPAHQRQANMVFQNYALFPHLSVFENVAFGLRVRRLPRPQIESRVESILSVIQLTGFAHRKPSQLSGGQQQRVALARALVLDPKVLLLDEPLGALDQKLRKEMQFELKRIQRQLGITFIYVTHDQEEALTMSDRIAVMNHGRVLQTDVPAMLYDRPVTRFVADFIGTSNFLPAQLLDVSGRVATVEVEGLGKLRTTIGGELTTSSTGWLIIRPERLRLGEVAADDNSVRGKVEEVVFIGSEVLYLVRVTSELVLTVRDRNEGPEHRLSVSRGQEVQLSWSASAMYLIVE
jgi:spermidine/putrescine transport system ATP-binding protein